MLRNRYIVDNQLCLQNLAGFPYLKDGDGGWGYTSVEKTEFLEELKRIMEAIGQSELICGYCYTQLADVEQEINGLLTREHQYKFDPEQIKRHSRYLLEGGTL